MQYYLITFEMYDSKGGSFKYAINPSKTPTQIIYTKAEREQAFDKIERLLTDDMYYDNPKIFFINTDKVTITDITDRLQELKNQP